MQRSTGPPPSHRRYRRPEALTSDGIPKIEEALKLGISAYAGGSEEVVLKRPGGRARTVRHAELVEDVAHVPGDSLFADKELVGDGAIRLAGRQQPKHLRLTFAERAASLRRCPLRLLGDAGEPRHGVELREQPARGLELETTAVLIAPLFTDRREQEAGMRVFVRHLQLTPGLARLPQRC